MRKAETEAGGYKGVARFLVRPPWGFPCGAVLHTFLKFVIEKTGSRRLLKKMAKRILFQPNATRERD